jgi:hypothetical protein
VSETTNDDHVTQLKREVPAWNIMGGPGIETLSCPTGAAKFAARIIR